MFAPPGIAFLVSLGVSSPAHAQYDLLLRGGHVLDPKNSVDGRRDVALAAGKIAAVSTSIDPARAKVVIDVTGLYVTPGIIDLHTHLFATTGIQGAWAGDMSVMPDGFSFRNCVTTMVDAGSAGWSNFETFRHTVIDRSQTRVLALINISRLGMITDAAEQDERDFQPDEVARVAAKHDDVVVGVKSAHYQRPDWTSVDRAIEAGVRAGVFVMVDFGYFLPERPYWELVTRRLRPGDVSTHVFRGPVPVIDGKGRVYDYLHAARARGVKFDVGHGMHSFVFRNAAGAVRGGFYPDTISTDLHAGNMNGAMMDMPTTMSKFLAMGMPLAAVVRASTSNPAAALRRPTLGHLAAGAGADVAVFRLQRGSFGFVDPYGGRLPAKDRLHCELTLRDGRVVWDWNGRMGTDYRKLEPQYGIRPGIDHIVLPRKE